MLGKILVIAAKVLSYGARIAAKGAKYVGKIIATKGKGVAWLSNLATKKITNTTTKAVVNTAIRGAITIGETIALSKIEDSIKTNRQRTLNFKNKVFSNLKFMNFIANFD